MAHPKDNEVYPVDSVVRLKSTGQFAIIKRQSFQKNGEGFLNYEGEIEGREGIYCLIHDRIELECLPQCQTS
jgi:hypothetical protein